MLVTIVLCLGFADHGAAAPPLTTAQAKHLFNAHGCNACHAVDEFRIGPAFRDVATRYADADADTAARLVDKVLHGGGGAWGVVPMVSNPRLSTADAQAMVEFILALPPAP